VRKKREDPRGGVDIIRPMRPRSAKVVERTTWRERERERERETE